MAYYLIDYDELDRMQKLQAFVNNICHMNKWNSMVVDYKKINGHHESIRTKGSYQSVGLKENENYGLS